jgi:hypothetical protein
VAEVVAELESKISSTTNLLAVVFWCLDSAAFYSFTDDSILPPVRDISGLYHIHGALITAPSEMFAKSIKTCIPLFNTSTSAKKLILLPFPRYLQKRCCTDTDHVSNLSEDDYEANMFSGLDGLRRITKDTLFLGGVRDTTILNTSQLCISQEGSKTTGSDVRDAIAIMWGEDPVHPSRECYSFLAEHLEALILQPKPGGSSSTSTIPERPLKRPRWLEDGSDDLVTPRNSAGGHGRGRGGRGGFRGRGGGRGRSGFKNY